MEKIPANFREDCLKVHNQYRGIHNAAPLGIDQKLNDCAQEWADQLAGDGVVKQRTLIPYGENVYVASRKDPHYKIRPKDPVDSWYREGRYYKYGVEPAGKLKNTEHFTQLIWKGTKTMGLGMATDSDGTIYIVCNYEPVGNVEGEFAKNVMPAKEEDIKLQPLEEVGIKFVEPRLDVVESMERLYAVPSEMLRVWTVWLTKVSEIGEEWQRWLRAHIDLVVRLSERLQAVEDGISQGTKEEDNVGRVFSDATYTIASNETSLNKAGDVPATGKQRSGAQKTANNEPALGRKQETKQNAQPPKPARQAVTIASSAKRGKSGSALGAARSPEEEVEEEEYDKKTTGRWPVGRPWRPLGPPPEVTEEEKIQVLDIPKNIEEMTQLIQDFTHQATIYRSYYKHWMETREQAIKEIGGRTVMSTVKVRGKDKRQTAKGFDLQPSQYPSASDGKSTTDTPLVTSSRRPASEQGISKGTRSAPDLSAVEKSAPDTNEEESELSESADDHFVTPSGSQSDAARTDVSEAQLSKSGGSAVAMTAQSKSKTSVGPGEKKRAEFSDVDEKIRDLARACEDIPYFFYVKAEPDIEIAIEHDDEEVIQADPDREIIFGNYTRLYFNLADKPGKGGKPWI